MNHKVAWAVWAAGMLATGCTGFGSQESWQQRVIEDTDPDQVLGAAAAILQREFGRVRVDYAARRIVTSPVEFTTRRESGTARDLYRGQSTMRRSAQFNVGRSGGQTVARIRIDVERRDTERQRVFQPRGYRLSDTPGQETPIETDAATTGEQNAVWTRVRSDRAMERAVLEELREQFARGPRPSAESQPGQLPATVPGPANRP